MTNVKRTSMLSSGAHLRRIYLAMPCFVLALAASGTAGANSDNFDQRVMDALKKCQHISSSCAAAVKDAPGVLVFPSVVKADLIIGGAGGKGALIENGQITAYYSLGSASVGLQAGIERASQVYVFRTNQALTDLKNSPDWKAGASAGVTVITKDANANAMTGNVFAYVFDSKGLRGGVSLDVFDIWKSDQPRPQ